jgi:hypothetical protein
MGSTPSYSQEIALSNLDAAFAAYAATGYQGQTAAERDAIIRAARELRNTFNA